MTIPFEQIRFSRALRAISLGLLTMQGASPVVADDEDSAWALFSQGKAAFEDGRLNHAERLLREAIDLHRHDGTLLLNKSVRYRFAGTGNNRRIIAAEDGTPVDYQPNALLSALASQRSQMTEASRLEEKRLSPPELRLQLVVQDEDSDGFFQAGEPLALEITVKNQGKGTADNVTLWLSEGSQLPALQAQLRLGQIEAQKEQSETIAFQLPRDFAEESLSITVRTEEQDGFSSEVVRSDIPVTRWEAPLLAVTPVTPAVTLVAGRTQPLKYRLENRGKFPARNFAVQLESQTTGVQIVEQQWAEHFKLLRAGDWLPLNFSVKPSVNLTQRINSTLVFTLDDLETAGQKATTLANLAIPAVPQEGKYQVAEYAVSAVGNTAILGTSIPDGFIPAFSPNPIAPAHGFAVAIGNSAYTHLNKPVPYALNDARVMKKAFKTLMQIPDANIQLLENATLSDFQTLFGVQREKGRLHHMVAARKDIDTLYVYYSGHGIPAKNRNWSAYLMPSDGYADYIEESGYSLDMLYDQLAMLPVKRILVMLDACFSGESPAGALFERTSFGTLINVRIPKARDDRVMVLSAATAEDMGLWLDQAQQGLFTTYLVRGLTGEADNGDKQLSLDELYHYVRTRVSGAAAFMARSQTPTLQSAQNPVLLTYGYR